MTMFLTFKIMNVSTTNISFLCNFTVQCLAQFPLRGNGITESKPTFWKVQKTSTYIDFLYICHQIAFCHSTHTQKLVSPIFERIEILCLFSYLFTSEKVYVKQRRYPQFLAILFILYAMSPLYSFLTFIIFFSKLWVSRQQWHGILSIRFSVLYVLCEMEMKLRRWTRCHLVYIR